MELRKILKDLKISNEEIAHELQIKSLSTVSLKINGKADFSTKEAGLLKKLINTKSNKQYTFEELFDNVVNSNQKNDN